MKFSEFKTKVATLQWLGASFPFGILAKVMNDDKKNNCEAVSISMGIVLLKASFALSMLTISFILGKYFQKDNVTAFKNAITITGASFLFVAIFALADYLIRAHLQLSDEKLQNDTNDCTAENTSINEEVCKDILCITAMVDFSVVSGFLQLVIYEWLSEKKYELFSPSIEEVNLQHQSVIQ